MPNSYVMELMSQRKKQIKGATMNDNDAIYSDVLNYFAAEFDALEERLKTGALDDYRERVLVSRKIGEAVNLLSPYVRSDPRARHLVRNAEALKKELLSVRELMVKQMLQQKEQQSLLRSIIERKKPGVGETL
ncbi:hypothetical protein [Geomesophilobacter sediminis]|nr:hypothetical protein [Geomesophilobacter sediminis]